MTKKIRKVVQWILVGSLLLSLFGAWPNLKVEAADATTPTGVDASQYFLVGSSIDWDYPDDDTRSNSQHNTNTIGVGSPVFAKTFDLKPTTVVNLTNETSSPGKVGNIWSKGSDFTYTQKQKIGFWLKFPDVTKVGDGIAFVLQNDLRGTKDRKGLNVASTFMVKDSSTTSEIHYYNKPNNPYDSNSNFDFGPMDGQTLGVYGTKRDNEVIDKNSWSDPVNHAIKNSWALEFDTKVNNATDKTTLKAWDTGQDGALPGTLSSSFDVGISGQHIAATYPGEKSTYNDIVSGSNHYFTLKHDKTKLVNLTNDVTTNTVNNGWHHVTLDWSGAALRGLGQMHMSFNDKNINGSAVQSAPTEETYDIDMSKVDPGNTGKARWGITSSTSNGSTAQQSVVLDTPPTVVQGSAKTTLTNAANQSIPDISQTASAGSLLTQTYTINYDNLEAADDWSNIVAKLPIPAGTTLANNAANPAVIRYSDGTTENITETASTTGFIQHTLAKSLSKAVPSAKITLQLKANQVSTDTKVTFATATFTGKQATATVVPPEFTIMLPNEIRITAAYTAVDPFTLTKNE